jgi:hypothetical protein
MLRKHLNKAGAVRGFPLPSSISIKRYAKVLSDAYKDRFKQTMTLKLAELKKESLNEFSEANADAARRGCVSSSFAAGLQNQVDVHLIEKSITAAVELQKELILGLHMPFSDSLATELKRQVKAYVSNSWCEGLHRMNVSSISEQHAARLKEELLVNRDFFLKRAEAQIDFLVDTLRTKQSGPPHGLQ